jgi:hypothetical protein
VVSRKIKAMQGAARRVVENYQSTGEPFCLFLSSWSFDEMRAGVLELLDDIGLREGRGKQDVQVRIGLERQVAEFAMSRPGDAVTVRAARNASRPRATVPGTKPPGIRARQGHLQFATQGLRQNKSFI